MASQSLNPLSQLLKFRPVAVTMGDPAGIGVEVTLKAWLARQLSSIPEFFLMADRHHVTETASQLGLDVPIHSIKSPAETSEVFQTALPLLEHSLATSPIPGKPEVTNATAIIASIDSCVDLVSKGEALAVVTNPIHKQGLYEAGFTHPGHTEYLAHLAGIETPPVMMLATGELRVVPATIHVSIADAITMLNADMIVELGQITHTALKQDFAITQPRLAIAGLNPHAGEGGAMGSEETTIIEPALLRLRNMGIDVSGPYPPDTLFTERTRQTYDAALCMYHDQALIPIKTLDFDGGVNITLGLPFVRTSPDHGTAFNIAGRGLANERSMITAIKTASQLAQNRLNPNK